MKGKRFETWRRNALSSAGAGFLRHNASVWTADKDGLIMELRDRDDGSHHQNEHYRELMAEFGAPCSIDAPLTTEHKARPKTLWPEAVQGIEFAEAILAQLSHAPHNNAPIDGLKVIARSRWFAARPFGTEAVYKIYAESFNDEAHLDAIVREARKMVDAGLSASGAPVVESGQAG